VFEQTWQGFSVPFSAADFKQPYVLGRTHICTAEHLHLSDSFCMSTRAYSQYGENIDCYR